MPTDHDTTAIESNGTCVNDALELVHGGVAPLVWTDLSLG